MATTTNYGWTTPDDTALVKDGAAAIRSLGSAIDTSLNTALGTKKSGLVLLNTTSFSGVSSTSLAANTFSSTYDNYQIILNIIHSASTELDLNCRFRTSGSDNTTSNYSEMYWRNGWNNTAYNIYTNATSTLKIATISSLYRTSYIFNVLQPFASLPTVMTTQGITGAAAAYSNGFSYVGAGNFSSTTSFDSLSFYVGSGNITGTYYVYAYNK